MERGKYYFWTRIVVLNLFVLAFVGLILRYKIVFSLPLIDQKHLLHGHSHFAFAGWVSQALMVLLFFVIGNDNKESKKQMNIILWSNLICAFGMLFSFAAEGYAALSITFSTLSIFMAYWFCVLAWRKASRLNSPAARFLLKTGLFCHVISSLGAFTLATMMANQIMHQSWYLAAIYFFLHFEYNGWFILVLLSLTFEFLHNSGFFTRELNYLAMVLALCVFPTYFLSTLWMELPAAIYLLVVLAALAQLIVWVRLIWIGKKNIQIIRVSLSGFTGTVLVLSAIAMSMKLFLQAGSTIPALSTWAFGYRPIVIGYLHLVLLGVVSLGIIGMFLSHQLISLNTMVRRGIIVFTCGVILNELLLLLQAIGAISMSVVPLTNEFLILTALTMMTGVGILFIALNRKQSM
jgi:hypothetical protein